MIFSAYEKAHPPRMRLLTETLRVMKLMVVLLFISVFQVSAKPGYAQTISLDLKNVPLENAFEAITRQTGYHFVFWEEQLKGAVNVTVRVSSVDLSYVLDLIMKGQPVQYKIDKESKQVIIVVKREEPKVVEYLPGREIDGEVVDEDGGRIEGATITVKGTKQVIAADSKGRFSLANVDPNAVLVISCVGYETVEIPLKGRDSISISLKRRSGPLDEVQVIAYGTTTQRFTVGNEASVGSEDIERQPVSNVLEALEGRVPGLFITQANGMPGGGVNVQIQGQNSIQKGNDPFYVVDGVPFISALPSTGVDETLGSSNNSGNGSPFSYLNPSDIESIEVLKDADATSIYGSRAANGAILITTKKGKEGAVKFDFNIQQGIGQITRKADMMNTRQYLNMRYNAFSNDEIPLSSLDQNGNYDLTVWDTTRYTNWQNALIGGTAQYSNITGSVSGGTSSVQYLVSGTYHKETTVFPGNFSDQKGAVHFSLTSSSVNQRFHLQFSGNYMFDNNQLPQQDLTGYAVPLEPDAPVLFNPDGTLNWAPNSAGISTWQNPLIYLYENYQNKTTNLVSNAVLSYSIMKGLNISASFGYTNTETNDFAPVPLIAVAPELRAFSESSAEYGSRMLNSWVIEPQASYNKVFGKSKIDLLLGSTIDQINTTTNSLYGQGYNSDQVLQDMNAAATLLSFGSTVSQYRYNAFFGRANYKWQDKYIIDVTTRRDGSSRFGPDNEFHDFWSAGAGWIFSQDAFMKDQKSLSFGKLRVSYGTTGNDQIGDYQFISLYNVVSNQGLPYQNSTGLAPNNLPNPYLQWELTRKLQGGADLGFVKDRILINITYAVNRSSNQLLSYALPSITGFTSIVENFPATVQNNSWEFSLNTINIKTKVIKWTSSINLTIPKNKLVAFPDLSSSTYSSTLIVGQPIGVQRVLHFLGVDPTSGEYLVAGSNGKPTSSPNYPSDYTILINPFPSLYGGISNSFSYERFQLDFLFQFVRRKGVNYNLSNGITSPGVFNDGFSNQPITVLNSWQKPGDITSIAKYSTSTDISYDYAEVSDYTYTDASYIRLKNVSISWQIPSNWKRTTYLKNARIYIQGQNLLTFTRYKGINPENLSNTALPPLRVLTMGVQIGF